MKIKSLYFTFMNFFIVIITWSLWKIGTINGNNILQFITILVTAIYTISGIGGEALSYWIYLPKQKYIVIIKCLVYTIIFDIILLIIAQNLNESAIMRVKYAIINQIIGYILGNTRKLIIDKENKKDTNEQF